MYTNIRGFKGKKSSLTEILNENKPHLFFLTETQMRTDSNEQIDGYTFFGRKREGKIGGGVAFLARNDIKNSLMTHYSERNIEIIWTSIRRKGNPPFFIGTYYGKQETRTNKEEIEKEMELLMEEIEEQKNEGEILLTMDGNAKIGLLGENVSRNGKLLLKLIEETNLVIMNKSEKCKGRITRQNTKNKDEFSAIDFVLITDPVEKWIKHIEIDEQGLNKISGRHETDHNTIIIDMTITNLDYIKPTKRVGWNLNAPEEKWKRFEEELKKTYNGARDILENDSIEMEEKYNKWYKQIDKAARSTIGKTTYKEGYKEKPSSETKKLRIMKKDLKKSIQQEKDQEKKQLLINKYREVQEMAKEQISKEKSEMIRKRFERIKNDKTGKSLWKEKKIITRNPALETLSIKDDKGRRQYLPEDVKETTAKYYENLYKEKVFPYHPYHTKVQTDIETYSNNFNHETMKHNNTPELEEVTEIIMNKKNGKSTPDLKNEILKKPGETMIRLIYPMITAIWKEEKIPSIWNIGNVTSIWKGRGDKEDPNNQRGITTSSSIGTILDSIIDNRIASTVPFTQAQGGGKRGASTYDHLFILRAIMDIAKKQKRPLFLTFYDVSKAYDNVDNADMLKIMWDKGLKGKTWRILKELNSNLKAKINTRYGQTRIINMEIGGKQGSRLTGRMFSKLMDMLQEEIEPTGEGFQLQNDLIIPYLLWVDDVVSCVEGQESQEKILKRVNEFGVKHKLKWGAAKCNVLKIGKHKENKHNEWKLGEEEIKETDKYKYLGDIITSDGKNERNIEARKNKVTASIVSLNTIAASDVLRRIETTVLLELHDKIILSALLTNAEAWTLNITNRKELDKIEIQALKYMFDLPTHTPTPAIIYSFGTLYTQHRLDKKQLLYLHKLLNHRDETWTKRTLMTLINLKLGWGKSIMETLSYYDLPTNLEVIKKETKRRWKRIVKERIEVKNRIRLHDDCHKTEDGVKIPKTKTKRIIQHLDNPMYQRQPLQELLQCTKQETKAIIIARYGMLECGQNFKGSLRETCAHCNEPDNENHRLNFCKRYEDINLYNSDSKANFDDIYSDNIQTIKGIVTHIEKVWNVRTAHGNVHG